jgi:transcriptional regulator with XRE-family HTH domain
MEQVISGQIRSLRRTRSLTLDELARTTGLSKGFLSRIERGEKAPSVATVMKLADALGVSVAELFGEKVEDAAIHVVRADARSTVKSSPQKGSYTFAALSKPGTRHKIESFVIYPSADFSSEGHITHGGEEALLVLDGKIEVSVSDRNIPLSVGDYLQFPGHLKHRIRRLSRSAAALVIIALE